MTPVPSKWLTTLKFMLKPGRVVCSNERPPHQRRALFDPSWRPSRNYDIFQTGRLVTTPCLVRGHGEMSFLPLMGDFVHILSCTFEAVNCIKKAYLEYVLERSQTLRLSPHAHTHSTQNTSTKSITAVTDSLTNVLVISATKKKKTVVSLPRIIGGVHSWTWLDCVLVHPPRADFPSTRMGFLTRQFQSSKQHGSSCHDIVL